MCIHRASVSPARDDQIDALPQWNIDIVGARNVIEQAYPKCGQRFVIETADAVMGRERANIAAHSFERLIRRQLPKVTHRHRNVSDMGEFRSRNRCRFKCFHQRGDFGVARKISRLQ